MEMRKKNQKIEQKNGQLRLFDLFAGFYALNIL